MDPTTPSLYVRWRGLCHSRNSSTFLLTFQTSVLITFLSALLSDSLLTQKPRSALATMPQNVSRSRDPSEAAVPPIPCLPPRSGVASSQKIPCTDDWENFSHLAPSGDSLPLLLRSRSWLVASERCSCISIITFSHRMTKLYTHKYR